MYRIGVISSDLECDWASRRLLEAVNALAVGSAVDPMRLQLAIDGDAAIRIQGEPATAYDAYIVRSLNSRGEVDYQYEVFELLERQGTLVMNSPAALSVAESKPQTTFFLQRAGLPVPRTTVTQEVEEATSFVNALGTAVLKPLYGSHGIGIELANSDAGAELVLAFLEKYGAVYVQEHIPNEGRDIRAFVVGDDIPAAVYRVAAEGEWKTNVSQGGECQLCSPTARLRELCLEAARAVGLDYTGIDIIEGPDGPVIIELNGAPSWQGLSDAANRNVAADVARHVLEKLSRGESARQPA